MPVLRIHDEEAKYLVSHYQESGMGYQIFESRFTILDRTLFLALNSEFVIPFGSLAELRQELAGIGGFSEAVLRERARLVYLSETPSYVAERIGWRLAASALDPEVEWNTRLEGILQRQEVIASRSFAQPRMYFRLSAFRRDRRVMPDGGFVRGTYATTYNDLKMVPSGFAAVGRYALPSTLSARYVFPIVTGASPIYVGTTTPNFGQAGGGVEVLFPNGATPLLGEPHEGPED